MRLKICHYNMINLLLAVAFILLINKISSNKFFLKIPYLQSIGSITKQSMLNLVFPSIASFKQTISILVKLFSKFFLKLTSSSEFIK